MSVQTHVNSYDRPSSLDVGAGRLLLETSGGVALRARSRHPRFFDGMLVHPQVAGSALRQVAQVAAASYVRRDRNAGGLDPVVTSDGVRLRFESFSLCGGVLARLDVLPEGLDGDVLDRGTTNVDVNEPLRRMLSRLSPAGMLHLSVGTEGLVATTETGAVIETKVPLPARWLRGFAEAAHIGASFEPRLQVSGAEGLRFLTGLGRSASGWLLPAGRGLRLSSRPAPGAVFVSGSQRLESLLPLLPHASTLRAYGPTGDQDVSSAASAWEVVLPGARYLLTLSPEPGRGFSGEGAGLAALAAARTTDDAEAVAAHLGFQPVLDPDLLADASGLSRERVRTALACLGTTGRVGYDVTEAAWFHRELPYDAAAVARLNPRLRRAEALVSDQAVRLVDESSARVRGSETTHTVHTEPDGRTSCTCDWWVTHRGGRGPCSHELAVQMTRARGRG
ncbi:SWIM zinc finger family protein [Nocardioides campestrisoli]|uniref:SWIM zinc finger family protein n=1 Tax=Nocardioides campestrisoli TaxID=2736757 RepID=UPI001CD20B50|nr:SWIM zinc finger family protein [Nocardioides campestrisoli]